MSKYLVHVASLVINQPLWIMPELGVIASALEGRINIDASDLAPPEQKRTAVTPMGSRYVGEFAPIDPNNPRAGAMPYRTTKEGIAIIPVHGSLVNRGGFLDAMPGIASYEKIKFQVRAAAADKDVASILLDIESILLDIDKSDTGDGPGGDSRQVTAQLTGSAEVTGETTVKVEVAVTPSSELINATANAKAATAQLRGSLNANGPGSTGKSSPDAF